VGENQPAHTVEITPITKICYNCGFLDLLRYQNGQVLQVKSNRGELLVPLSSIGDEPLEKEWMIDPALLIEDDSIASAGKKISFKATLYKAGDSVSMTGDLVADLILTCNRCLVPFDYEVDEKVDTIYLPKSDEVPEAEAQLTEEDMDAQVMDGENIDLLPPLRDALLLAIPMSRVCKEECKGLCSKCGADLNKKECDCKPDESMSPFAKLKQLKLD
jgi:uncharacterized protein